MARQYGEAIEQCQKTIDLEPGLFLAHFHLGMAYLEKGLYARARAAFQTGKRLSAGSPLMLMALARADAMAGQRARAQRAIRDLKQLSHQRYVPALYIAVVYASLGDRDQAFTWLQNAVQERSNQLVYLKTQPAFDNLRSDPRFNALLRSIGLPP